MKYNFNFNDSDFGIELYAWVIFRCFSDLALIKNTLQAATHELIVFGETVLYFLRSINISINLFKVIGFSVIIKVVFISSTLICL